MTCNSCLHLTYEGEIGFYCALDGENKSHMDSCDFYEFHKPEYAGKLSDIIVEEEDKNEL